MAAADRVKPAEFKVAFWQLAFYGEIAFIAFWFFLMLGLGVYHDDWKAEEPAVQTVPLQKPIAIPLWLERWLTGSTPAITPPCESSTTRR